MHNKSFCISGYRLIGLLVIILSVSATMLPVASVNATGMWRNVGSLLTPSEHHTATLLPNGKVLVTGGARGDDTRAAIAVITSAASMLYDPVSETWSKAAPMKIARYGHTATLLPNGKVLVLGGCKTDCTHTDDDIVVESEIYDPASDTWSDAAPMPERRTGFTATLLTNGKVLVAGGCSEHCAAPDGASYPAVTELYDPDTDTWHVAASMKANHLIGTTATLLADGRVLVVGAGYDDLTDSNGEPVDGTAELYDPLKDTWSLTSHIGLPRNGHTATLLNNGKVLIAGGYPMWGETFFDNAELYDPVADTWHFTEDMEMPLVDHTATMLNSGWVLITGGTSDWVSNPIAHAELYDPVRNVWMTGGRMTVPRYWHTATLLSSGQVLVVGGCNGPCQGGIGTGSSTGSAELFTYPGVVTKPKLTPTVTPKP